MKNLGALLPKHVIPGTLKPELLKFFLCFIIIRKITLVIVPKISPLQEVDFILWPCVRKSQAVVFEK